MGQVLASLVWKLRQGTVWHSTTVNLPAESASRVACALCREFGGKSRFTPSDFDVTGEIKRSSYNSDTLAVKVRRLKDCG